MPFTEGNSGNPNGRPKGKPNKSTDELRLMVSNFIESKWDIIEQDFESVKPRERLQFIEKLLSFVIPRLKYEWISPGDSLSEFLNCPEEEQNKRLVEIFSKQENENRRAH